METSTPKEEVEFCLIGKGAHDLSTSEPDIVRCSSNAPEIMIVEASGCHESSRENDESNLKRRLSLGDIPYTLSYESGVKGLNFLLGRVMRSTASSHHIRITEVAPTHSSIRQDDPCVAWKMPVEIFSSKKQTNVKELSRRVRSYYKAQDELISAYEDIALGIEVEMSPHNLQQQYRRAIFFSKVTLFINFLLLIAKLVASIISGSMSIISSLVDSALDLFSGVIMWWATRAVKNRNIYNYPQGRTKIEPVAVIILSVAMALASLQLVRESVERIIALAHYSVDLPNVEVVTFTISGITVVVKCCLWLICRKEKSSTILALAQDHRNDVMSNLTAIVFGYWGSGNLFDKADIYGFVFLDPLGAILISIYIMYNWWKTGSEQIKCLTGHTARPDFLSKLTWVCVNHHVEVKQIDTVRAFHFGNNFLVEVDIVLPSDMRLQDAHDIGESLQQRLESLPEVERAFVHLDYEFTHNPHSEHKIV